MIDWIVNLFQTIHDTSCLCSEECIHLSAKDNKHYCSKYKKILTCPDEQPYLCHPIENCGGMIEEIATELK